MKNAILLHGVPDKEEYYDPKVLSPSNSHWLPWLQSQLLKHDIPTATPEVPWSFDKNWEIWNNEVERFDIGPETLLVGHSTGAGFFIKYLSIHKDLTVGKVVVVAPWLDPYQEEAISFFDDFEIDPTVVSRTDGITIFNSDNDQDSVQKSVSILRDKIGGIHYREFKGYGHFCLDDMKTIEFPELLEEILYE